MSGEVSSGWLKEVPSGWGMGHLRWLAQRFAGGTPNKDNEAYWTDGTIPWLNSGAVNQFTVTEPSAFITDEAYRNSSAKWIPEGALVMALAGQGKTKGMVAQLAITTTCNQSMAAIVPTDEITPRFLLWWLTSNYQNIRNMAGGDDRDGLNLELLGNIVCPLPTLPEQTAVAAFLDRETAKIDALVEEQRRLIELLKEKRQAIISHAVTKGLDPAATMKPSGVEWLGDVPAHWQVRPLKHAVRFESGGTPSKANPDYWDGDVPWASAKDLKSDVLATTQDFITQNALDEGAASLVLTGSVVVLVRGMMLARAFPVVLLAAPMAINQDLKALIGTALRGDFLAWVLRGSERETLSRLDEAGHGTKALRMEAWISMGVPIPAPDEQQEIADHLSHITMHIDELAASANQAIALLQERRSALISAAVTGKIDVREPAATEAHDVRQLVAAEIIGRLSHMLTFGRVKFQKIVYLAEVDAGITELSGKYLRAAAGPLDHDLIDRLETALIDGGRLVVQQPGGAGGTVTYRMQGTVTTQREELSAALGERVEKLDHIITVVKDLDTKGTEAIATLYAVWNDFLLDGKQPADDEIVSGFLNDWHPEKREKFRAEELRTWLGYMRRNNLTPSGTGPRTTMGRLFV